MNKLDQLRQMMSFAIALYLFFAVAHMHSAQGFPPVSLADEGEKLRSGLTWYLEQVVADQSNQTMLFYPD